MQSPNPLFCSTSTPRLTIGELEGEKELTEKGVFDLNIIFFFLWFIPHFNLHNKKKPPYGTRGQQIPEAKSDGRAPSAREAPKLGGFAPKGPSVRRGRDKGGGGFGKAR